MNPADAATLAAARWLVYVCAVFVIGHAGAELAVRRAGFYPESSGHLRRSLFRWAIGLVVATIATLGAQAYSWFGAEGLFDIARLQTMLESTVWGRHWMIAAAASAVAAAISAGLPTNNVRRRPLLLMLAILVAVSAPLTGHGGAGSAFNRTMHAAHLAGAGFWIGTLAVLMMIVWPALRTTVRERDWLTALLRAFSPVALTAAGVLTLSGLALSVVNVTSLDALFGSAYGQTLLVKLAAVGGVVTIGFMNWRSHTKGVHDAAVLRRLAIAECVLGLVVILAITAWLGGLEIPAELVAPAG